MRGLSCHALGGQASAISAFQYRATCSNGTDAPQSVQTEAHRNPQCLPPAGAGCPSGSKGAEGRRRVAVRQNEGAWRPGSRFCRKMISCSGPCLAFQARTRRSSVRLTPGCISG